MYNFVHFFTVFITVWNHLIIMDRNRRILTQLQKDVSRNFGRQVSTATDCDQLRSLLKEKLDANLSSQTLRRFFQIIKSDSKSSIFTLDILSIFCGFKDFKDFSQSYNQTELETFFEDKDNNDKDFWQKSEQLCKRISESPELLATTHHRLMTFPMARKYFIENHPMRDLIGTVYSQYFLAYLKFDQTNEAKIFAYGLLFKSAFLLQNKELMELYYNKVLQTDLTDSLHVIPAGLKYGTQLLYADFIEDEKLYRKHCCEMKKVRLQYENASAKSVCSFEYTVLESLIFTGRTKEMKFLIQNNTVQKADDQSFIPFQRKQTHVEVWNILCSLAFQKMGDEISTQLHLDQVDLENLGIGWKKYYSMLYYFVQLNQENVTEKTKIVSKVKKLIDETHFSYFEALLDHYLEFQTIVRSEKSRGKKSEKLMVC